MRSTALRQAQDRFVPGGELIQSFLGLKNSVRRRLGESIAGLTGALGFITGGNQLDIRDTIAADHEEDSKRRLQFVRCAEGGGFFVP